MSNVKIPAHFGLDFGNHAIKLAYVERSTSPPTLKALVAKEMSKVGLTEYLQKQQNKVVNMIKGMVSETELDLKYVAVAIPEASVFSQIITVPKVKDDELTEAIYWKLKPMLPRPIDEFRKDYIVIKTDPHTGARKVLVVAAPASLVDLYVQTVERAGLIPVAVETEILANIRTVSYNYGDSGIILDFGSSSTDIGIFIEGNLVFSQSIATGSEVLTKAIMNTYNITYAQAEQYKRTFGLLKDKLQGKIYKALVPVMDSLSAEILRSLEFSRSDLKIEIPKTLYMVGQGSLLPGLSEYFQESLHLNSAIVVNPLNKLNVAEKYSKLKKELHPEYSISIGLSLKTD